MLLDDGVNIQTDSSGESPTWTDLPLDFATVLWSLSNLKSTMSPTEIVAPKVAQHAVAVAAYLEPDKCDWSFCGAV
ncbi:MAG: hypothetical protein LBP35_04340 [Candidatus Ancillula trichonymphae]|jgi:hypothetical protein|nr:hypothetical protein [Candidatus Ancillula trichonymphae]